MKNFIKLIVTLSIILMLNISFYSSFGIDILDTKTIDLIDEENKIIDSKKIEKLKEYTKVEIITNFKDNSFWEFTTENLKKCDIDTRLEVKEGEIDNIDCLYVDFYQCGNFPTKMNVTVDLSRLEYIPSNKKMNLYSYDEINNQYVYEGKAIVIEGKVKLEVDKGGLYIITSEELQNEVLPLVNMENYEDTNSNKIYMLFAFGGLALVITSSMLFSIKRV